MFGDTDCGDTKGAGSPGALVYERKGWRHMIVWIVGASIAGSIAMISALVVCKIIRSPKEPPICRSCEHLLQERKGYDLHKYRFVCDNDQCFDKSPKYCKRYEPIAHGTWLNPTLFPDDITGHMVGECSNCNKVRIIDNYCSNCGEKLEMDFVAVAYMRE